MEARLARVKQRKLKGKGDEANKGSLSVDIAEFDFEKKKDEKIDNGQGWKFLIFMCTT